MCVRGRAPPTCVKSLRSGRRCGAEAPDEGSISSLDLNATGGLNPPVPVASAAGAPVSLDWRDSVKRLVYIVALALAASPALADNNAAKGKKAAAGAEKPADRNAARPAQGVNWEG